MHRGPCPGNGQSGVTGVSRSSGQILIIKNCRNIGGHLLVQVHLFSVVLRIVGQN